MSIKNYIKLIKSFYNKHDQINTVKSGNQFDFNAASNIFYPIAHIEYLNERISGETRTVNFLVTIADIFDPNLPETEEEIYSDSSQIISDTLDYFVNQLSTDWEVQESATPSKFNNGNVDRLCGHSFVLSFDEFREANDCIIPITV